MTIPRVVKKYPNRRLYDTGARRYIDLNDVRDLVTERADFIIVDRKTGRDITRSVLLQVVADLEQAQSAVLSQGFLTHVIRAHGTPVHGNVATALEETVRRFD